jgi:hypothetical protein
MALRAADPAKPASSELALVAHMVSLPAAAGRGNWVVQRNRRAVWDRDLTKLKLSICRTGRAAFLGLRDRQKPMVEIGDIPICIMKYSHYGFEFSIALYKGRLSVRTFQCGLCLDAVAGRRSSSPDCIA